MRKVWLLGGQQFMRAAVAHGAIGRAFVAAFPLLPVDAAGVIAGLVLMARCARRLRHSGGMGILVVRLVTGFAGQPRVSALLEFLPLIVAGNAIGCAQVPGGCPEKKNEGRTEP